MSTNATAPGGPKAYEERDVALRPIVATAIALLALLLFTGAFVFVLQAGLLKREAAESTPASPLAGSYGVQEPPAPRLQTDPRGDLLALHERERALLEGYGWTDRGAGRVHIPVDRAMALLLAEGRK